MIVPIRDEHGQLMHGTIKCVEHITKGRSKKSDETELTLPMVKEIWEREFGIEMLMDPTGTGYDRMRFRDEKHYTLWLLKWA
jgi:hypothetical protein